MPAKPPTYEERLWRRLPSLLADKLDGSRDVIEDITDAGTIAIPVQGITTRVVVLASGEFAIVRDLYEGGVRTFRRALTPAISRETIDVLAEVVMAAEGRDHYAMRILTWPHLARVLAMGVILDRLLPREPVTGPTTTGPTDSMAEIPRETAMSA